MTESKIAPKEAVLAMRQGATLLKAGRMGSPHFRHFKIEADFQTLTWTSPKKKSDQSAINLGDVREIRLGQTTPVFVKNRIPEHDRFSFSLIYGDMTLDIVCKDKKEFETWVVGLRALTIDPQSLNLDVLREEKSTGKTDRISVHFKGIRTIISKREENSDVYTWGSGLNGRLGHGDEIDQLTPKVVEALLGKGVKEVQCGPMHTVALTHNGELHTWGHGSFGRLGHGHERDRFTPLVISSLRGLKVIQVACGDFHSACLIDNGTVYTWGKGSDGRLGHGNEENCLSPQSVAAIGEPVHYIACGYINTAAVTGTGRLFVWGGNEKGQLGLGDKCTRLNPTEVYAVADCNIIRIALGTWHSIALTAEGKLLAWGEGSSGKLGNGSEDESLTPLEVEGPPNPITQVACGSLHCAALTSSGEVYTWGDGKYGQLGQGQVTSCSVPTKVAALRSMIVVQIACGANHTAALVDDGGLFTWGNGINGRLGHGDEIESKIPKPVGTMQGKQVRSIACGDAHSACTIIHGWVPDDECENCMACKKTFTFVNRRHHCRNCGGLFCGNCSQKRFTLLKDGFDKPVRVCDKCFNLLTNQ